MSNLFQNVRTFHELIERCENLEAIERFYAENLIVQENNEEPRIGKDLCLEQERKNLARVSNIVQRILATAINEQTGVVMTQMQFDFTTTRGRRRLDEVVVQHWREGKIVHERFYYKGFIDMD